jgi:large subunit ribosomal protein L4
MESKIYNQEGKEVGTVALPESVFGAKWNADLVHQVMTAMTSDARPTIAHAMGRGEVRGGGKKPWKQKGTGRSRHGSSRSPIWRGGGITHGPIKEKDYSRKINKATKAKALASILSRKARENELLFVDAFNFSGIKTKMAAESLKSLSKIEGLGKIAYKKGNRALVLVPEGNATVTKSFRNIPSIEIDEVRNINPVTALNYQYLVFAGPEASIKILESKMVK